MDPNTIYGFSVSGGQYDGVTDCRYVISWSKDDDNGRIQFSESVILDEVDAEDAHDFLKQMLIQIIENL